ncbi:MAG: DUF4340 domain-containing protein [Gammaproteobacteria bacterium]
MNRRRFALLVAALAVLAVLAGIGLYRERPGGGTAGLLQPGLKDQLNDIQRIVITGKGNETLATLERGASTWTVTERHNYPADVARIRKNLLALADARIVEEKTSNPDFYDRLGVQDLASATAGGEQLTLSGGKVPISVIVGQPQPGTPDLTYVRRVGEAKSWLVAAQFDLGKTSGEWLDRAVTDIPATRIQSVTITHPGVETLRITRTADQKQDGITGFQVADLPAGRQLSYPGIANGVAAVLADLQLEDVQGRDILGADPGKPVVARFVTTDGLTVEASAWRLPDGTRISFSASGAGAAEKEAATLNARLGGWVYTLPGYKTEQLTRRLQELLAPP